MGAVISDIAKQAGCSSATVSRVINNSGYVKQETREKVLKAMEKFNYQPNLVARSLATKQSQILGLMIPHILSPFFSSFTSTAEEAAEKLGYSLLLCDTREDVKIEAKSLHLLLNHRVDGIISTPVCGESRHYVLAAKSVPIVFAARKIEDIGICSVTVDNFAGSYRVIDHLIKQGHKDIGFINGPLCVSSGRDRWLGAKQAMLDRDVSFSEIKVKEGDFSAETGYRLTMELLNQPETPSALFAANHMTAVGVLRALRERGFVIPEDIAVASFEGFQDSVFDALIYPKLTANLHPTQEMASSAVNLVVEQIRRLQEGKEYFQKDIVLSTKLILNDSTSKVIG